MIPPYSMPASATARATAPVNHPLSPQRLGRNRLKARPERESTLVESTHEQKQMRVQDLISAYRHRGHKKANIDPLGMMERPQMPILDLAYHHLSPADLGVPLGMRRDGDDTDHRGRAARLHVRAQPVVQRLGDLRLDSEDWVKAGHRVLKDHGDVVPSDLPKSVRRGFGQIFTLK